jgi:hypothetical protein
MVVYKLDSEGNENACVLDPISGRDLPCVVSRASSQLSPVQMDAELMRCFCSLNQHREIIPVAWGMEEFETPCPSFVRVGDSDYKTNESNGRRFGSDGDRPELVQ